MIRFFCSLAILLGVAFNSTAQPTTGFWFNPNEPGRGFTLEQQGSLVFVATFLYDSSGRTTWYAVGPGPLLGDTLTGQLTPFSGNATLFTAGTRTTAGSPAGSFTVEFTSDTTAILQWPGGTVNLQHFDFLPAGVDTTPSPLAPESGYWWSPSEPGRGYMIEAQGTQLYVAGYMYDTQGNPVWYASGPSALVATGNGPGYFLSPWVQFGNGQTLGGAYKSPTVVNSNVANAVLSFTDARNGFITTGNYQNTIARFEFGTFGLTPPSILTSYPAGTSAPIIIATNARFGTLYASAADPAGVILPTVAVVANMDGTFQLTLHTNSATAAGRYTGNLVMTFCADTACTTPLSGSPVTVAYDVTATVPGLSTLYALAGASDWVTYQGNNGHTGFVQSTLNATLFTPRWSWSAPAVDTFRSITMITTANGKVFVGAGGSFQTSPGEHLYALNEFDASIAWSHDFSSLQYPSVNPPAVYNGIVYVAAGQQQSSAVYAFSASTGSAIFSTPMGNQWSTYLAPIVSNGMLYSSGGAYGGFYAFNASSGALAFSVIPPGDTFYTLSPTIDSSNVYIYVQNLSNILYEYDPASGATKGSIDDTSTHFSGPMTSGAPVLGAASSVFNVNTTYPGFNSSLVDFDIGGGYIAWSSSGKYSGNPAYFNGTVYATNNLPLGLEAHAESGGAMLWTWNPTKAAETSFIGDVLLTNNLVFVSTNVAVYAIDLTTHAPVWSYSSPGRLALSANGILYIATTNTYGVSNGNLVAINLH
jgi:hypothetical protein